MSSHIGKSDPELGRRVQEQLKKVGLATPTTSLVLQEVSGDEDKIRLITKRMTDVLEILGLDLEDDSICDTPNRLAKMYVKELFWGLDPDKFPKCTVVDNKMYRNGSFVLEKNIKVSSTCEHHFVSIDGFASVAYIPNNKVLGLSKLNRIVQYFSKRPQVQERLTEQVAEAIAFVADTPDVAVQINAAHFCVKTRGIQDVGSSTITFAARGAFAVLDHPLRRELLNCI